MTSRFKISLKHDISTLTIHVLICWNKVTLFGQVVPMCTMEQQGNFIPGVKIWSNLSYPLQGEDLYVKHWWEPKSGASKQF